MEIIGASRGVSTGTGSVLDLQSQSSLLTLLLLLLSP
jgi:hypothetical protein